MNGIEPAVKLERVAEANVGEEVVCMSCMVFRVFVVSVRFPITAREVEATGMGKVITFCLLLNVVQSP